MRPRRSQCALSRPHRPFARLRSRPAGWQRSRKAIGLEHSRCGHWRVDSCWQTRCVTSSCMRSLSNRQDDARRCGCAKGWWSFGADPRMATVGADSSNRGISTPGLTVDATDAALAHSTNEAQSETAHRAAEWYAAQLLAHYGRAQVLEWLKSGVPAGVVATIGQR